MGTKEHDISPFELREVMSYDEDAGGIVWTSRVSRNVFPGDAAGTLTSQGYLVLTYHKQRLQAHRVAWAIYYGYWPTRHIDHINGDRSDNRISNLRGASQKQNCANRGLAKNNKAGLKGVSLKNGKWRATIWSGKSIHLGNFPTPEEAHNAYLTEAKRLFGQFARGG